MHLRPSWIKAFTWIIRIIATLALFYGVIWVGVEQSILYLAKNNGVDAKLSLSSITPQNIVFKRIDLKDGNIQISAEGIDVSVRELISHDMGAVVVEKAQIKHQEESWRFLIEEPVRLNIIKYNNKNWSVDFNGVIVSEGGCLKSKLWCLEDKSKISIRTRAEISHGKVALKIEEVKLPQSVRIYQTNNYLKEKSFTVEDLFIKKGASLIIKKGGMPFTLKGDAKKIITPKSSMNLHGVEWDIKYQPTQNKPLNIQFEVGQFLGEKSKVDLNTIKASYSGSLIKGDVFISVDNTKLASIELLKSTLKAQWHLFSNNHLSHIDASIKAFEGEIGIQDGKLDLNVDAMNTISVRVREISLENLLHQLGYYDVHVSGKVSGTLPLVIDGERVRVKKGLLQGTQGKIEYRHVATSFPNPQLEKTLLVLKNYHYQSLMIRVNQNLSGNMVLAVKLKGHNPDFMNGRPVDLNLTIEEHIPSLINAIMAHDVQVKTH